MAKKDIDDFLIFCGMTATTSTLKKIKVKIVKIDRFFEGKLDKLELKDIHRYFSSLNKIGLATSTKNDFIKVFKRFLKWKYKDWNLRFDELKDLKSNGDDGRKLSKEELLTKDEMRLIFNTAESLKFKTMLLFMQETACRPQEMLDLTWKGINSNNKEVKLSSSKTGKIRTIPVKNTIDHLNRYKTECFHPQPKIDDRVFPITHHELTNELIRIEKSLELSKHLYPYLWRHSVLTGMIKKLSPKVYEMYSGHNLETGLKFYAHLDTEDLREELNNKIYGVEDLTKEDIDEIKLLKENQKSIMQVLDILVRNKKGETETVEVKLKDGKKILYDLEMTDLLEKIKKNKT